MFISGGLMISDRPLSKLKGSIVMKLSMLQLVLILVAITHTLMHTMDSKQGKYGTEVAGLELSFFLFVVSAILVLAYIIVGERVIESNDSVEPTSISEE